MKLLILGYGRHGKDTVAEMLEKWGLTASSSSLFCAKHIVFPFMGSMYKNAEECFNDRHNYREVWYHTIKASNLLPGPSLAERILAQSDIYVGMRDMDELIAAAPLFDVVIWVDRSEHLPPENASSTNITKENSFAFVDRYLDNNGDLAHLEKQVEELAEALEL